MFSLFKKKVDINQLAVDLCYASIASKSIELYLESYFQFIPYSDKTNHRLKINLKILHLSICYYTLPNKYDLKVCEKIYKEMEQIISVELLQSNSEAFRAFQQIVLNYAHKIDGKSFQDKCDAAGKYFADLVNEPMNYLQLSSTGSDAFRIFSQALEGFEFD